MKRITVFDLLDPATCDAAAEALERQREAWLDEKYKDGLLESEEKEGE